MGIKNNISRALLALAVVLLPTGALAYIEGGQNNRANIKSDQTIDDDLYIASNDVVVEGTVNGDVYAAGSSVTIRGTVNGDVFAAGSDVLIGGKVSGGVRAAGSTVRINGAQIDGSLSGFASSLVVERDSRVGGGLNFGASTASIRGEIARGIVGGASSVVLANSVGKNVDLGASDITLESTAKIAGDLTYHGEGANLHRDPGAQIGGEVKHLNQDNGRQENSSRDDAFGVLWGLLALYLVGALLLWIAPVATAGVTMTITRRPGMSAAIGAVAVLLALPIFIVLLISLIGIPLALILAVLFGIAAYLSKFFASLAIGSLIARRTGWKPNPFADAAVGLILITLLSLIPYIGWLAELVAFLLGLGGLLLWFTARRRAAAPAPVALKK